MTRDEALLFSVFCPGRPTTKGSFSYKGTNRRTNKAVVQPVNYQRLREWTEAIRWALLASKSAKEFVSNPINFPIEIDSVFFLARPKGHFEKDGSLAIGAPLVPTGNPDGDKLQRAVLDALTGLVYVDDALVVDGYHRKRYAPENGSTGVFIHARRYFLHENEWENQLERVQAVDQLKGLRSSVRRDRSPDR